MRVSEHLKAEDENNTESFLMDSSDMAFSEIGQDDLDGETAASERPSGASEANRLSGYSHI